MLGSKIAHYEVVDKIGEGGMGAVYRAHDTHLDRFVATRVLPRGTAGDTERRRRFIQEARAASALNHPNIVTVHDAASEAGIDYIVMEYVAGKTLDELIRRKPLRTNDALGYAIQIADALARAHSAGIVHRDLKPSNMMVDTHGLVKVLDFGLAKLTEAEPAGQAATATIRPHTEDGIVVGTAAYMSPEQAEGRKLDHRTDVFSFGLVLYEMACGNEPISARVPHFHAIRRGQRGPKAPDRAFALTAAGTRPRCDALSAQRPSAALAEHVGPEVGPGGSQGRVRVRQIGRYGHGRVEARESSPLLVSAALILICATHG
jgi:serine/threonine protein kinase